MIAKTLSILVDRLNSYIDQRTDYLEGKVVQLSPPVAPDGVMPVEANDKVLVFLSNISKDTLPQQAKVRASTGTILQTPNPLFLNLQVIVAANFRSEHYRDGLALLSLAIQCFVQHSVLDKNIEPSLPPSIDRILVDIENTNLGEAANLWGIFGGKYLPSILYKVRMLIVNGDGVGERFVPAAETVHKVGA